MDFVLWKLDAWLYDVIFKGGLLATLVTTKELGFPTEQEIPDWEARYTLLLNWMMNLTVSSRVVTID